MIRTVAETGSTNADLLQLARAGAAEEGMWLRAERQTAGRGRQGRAWASPVGNFYGSTLVHLRPGDPAPATLGFAAAVALAEVVRNLLRARAAARAGSGARIDTANPVESGDVDLGPLSRSEPRVVLKWPNDLLVGGAKLSGILLERAGDAVVIGVGVNLAHHPDLPDRATTSLAAQGVAIDAAAFAPVLADSVAQWIDCWREVGFAAIRKRWLELAHPPGTPLRAILPDGSVVEGAFETLDGDGALILRPLTAFGRALADGARRSIHAGDVFLV